MTRHDFTHYRDTPLETLTVSELTDALGIATSAALLGVTSRNIYTVRNTNLLGVERMRMLINEIRKDEPACRERLIIVRTQRARQKARKSSHAA